MRGVDVSPGASQIHCLSPGEMGPGQVPQESEQEVPGLQLKRQVSTAWPWQQDRVLSQHREGP